MLIINAATFIGVAVNVPRGNLRLIKATDAGAVTFHYASGDKVITMAVDEVIKVLGRCTGVTSTALQNVIIA